MIVHHILSSQKFQGYEEKCRKKRLLYRVIFELTPACNFNCLHCYKDAFKRKDILSTAQVKEIINGVAAAGCLHLTLTGGEIFTRHDISDILEHVVRCGMRINLFTNGALIDKKAVEHLSTIKQYVNRVDISLLGAKEATFDAVTQTKGNFKTVFNNIRRLKDAGIAVKAKVVLMKQNYREIPDFLNMIKAYGLWSQFSINVFPKVNGDQKHLKYRLSPEEAVVALKKLGKGRSGFSLGHAVPDCLDCSVGKTAAAITWQGKMVSCLIIRQPAYSLKRMPAGLAWERLKKFWDRVVCDVNFECRDCSLRGHCNWCAGRSYLENGSLGQCIRWDKNIAVLLNDKKGAAHGGKEEE